MVRRRSTVRFRKGALAQKPVSNAEPETSFTAGAVGGQFRPPAGMPIAVVMGENGQLARPVSVSGRANRSAAPDVGEVARPR
jgi:hypothetical protein